ncbi:hypothetical protein [Alicyclobacillus sp. ALC3]|uniref:hypothetical protein n=1 Tax=Alicyclobacillus sp. ALC3 TaxID=2796143 RepID=UPI0023795F44|nr:hypothetical protein [Alicyclobacillus sp. ALC3]WDL97511.1 hypothetical protein JC200_01920 [Alicyclobacillus sp. ALC3]
MKPGDLVFIRGTEGVAGPIKKITRSPYTHIAGLAVDDHLLESQAMRKIGYEPIDTYRGVADVYSCTQLTDDQRRNIVDAAQEWLGVRYDYLLFGSLAVRHIFGRTVPVYASRRRHICTTLWVDAYRSVGIDLCPGIDYPTPGELASSPLLELVGSY